MIRIDYDINGNKVAKFIPGKGVRGFSVQTNGNMPNTHRNYSKGDIAGQDAKNELHAYIKQHGTKAQKEALGWF